MTWTDDGLCNEKIRDNDEEGEEMGGSGAMYLMKNKDAKAVFDLLKSNGGMTCGQLVESIPDMTTQKCQGILRKLDGFGLVRKIGRDESKYKRYIWEVSQ